MNSKAIQEIEERCNAATPGPWTICNINPARVRDSDMNNLICELETKHSREQELTAFRNQAFIAQARTDIPLLLSALREKEEQNRVMREALKLCTDCENGYPERLAYHSEQARKALSAIAALEEKPE